MNVNNIWNKCLNVRYNWSQIFFFKKTHGFIMVEKLETNKEISIE